MGTRGYTVYRYKNYWFATYQQCDSYPDELGQQVLGQARSRRSLKSLRQELDKLISDLEAKSDDEQERFLGSQDIADPPVITTTPELWDVGVEWEYEIDLDRNIFRINKVPFFSLDNLPPRSVALKTLISYDSYGNRACNDAQYRFESIQPLPFEAAVLEPYHQLLDGGQSTASYIDMLGLSEHVTDGEMLRTRYLQTIVGYSMNENAGVAFKSIQEFRLTPDGDALSDRAWHDAFSIASIAFAPPIFFSWEDPHGCPRPPQRQDVCWIRNDVFIHITPHLSDENHLQAAIARVVNTVQKQGGEKQGIVFGVLFSFLHCVILKIDTSQFGNAGGLFMHSPPLPFLPSWFVNEPSTPGITALTRFGYCHPDPELFIKSLAFHAKPKAKRARKVRAQETGDIKSGISGSKSAEPCANLKDVSGPPTEDNQEHDHDDCTPAGRKIPLEIWHRVASFLPSIESLLKFGQVAKVCQRAAEMVLQCLHVDSWRVLAVIDDADAQTACRPIPDCFDPEQHPDLEERDIPFWARKQNSELRFTKFLAVRGDELDELWIGESNMESTWNLKLPKGAHRHLRVFSSLCDRGGRSSVPLVVVPTGSRQS
ncbi:hypothetical protein BJ138DRAFT_1163378 [Hygrophoropsis aurantiaca]|uniref:Uncharacterized protein n=1 Tax=Hygrophoropsis aurantiaca TaxID=72124 RepID=A0ACB7ZYK3_9AGAM|nr:hypothetical protein BJ138DRAFT_1163378 [Hygrophoropsis aurantiaca]